MLRSARHFRRFHPSIIFCLALLLLYAARPRPVRADVTDDQVLDAIHHEIDFLLSQKNANNNWEMDHKFGGEKWVYTGGRTAQVLYALLSAGRGIDDERLNPKSPELKPALMWLSQSNPDPMATYAAAYKAMAFATVPEVMRNPDYRAALAKAASFLENSVRTDGAYSYYWDYRRNNWPGDYAGNPGHWDNSNSQVGLLGVWLAQEAGIEIFTNYWNMVNAHWRGTEQADGTWRYGPTEITSVLNMTSAGLASMYITTECTDMDPPRWRGGTIRALRRR